MTSIIKVQNIQYTDGDAALTIADGGGVTLASDLTVDTTTLKVDSSNNRVGVGTASPDTEFHVKGATTVANFEGTGGSSFIGLKDSDDGTVGFMGVDGGSIKFQTSGGSYSDKLVIDAAGNVTIGAGNLVIGTAGKGIDFSATGDGSGTDTSELLDDYEEGTWTASQSVGGNSSITVNDAQYVKVGRMVHFDVVISFSGNDVDRVSIAGLPYTATNTSAGATY